MASLIIKSNGCQTENQLETIALMISCKMRFLSNAQFFLDALASLVSLWVLTGWVGNSLELTHLTGLGACCFESLKFIWLDARWPGVLHHLPLLHTVQPFSWDNSSWHLLLWSNWILFHFLFSPGKSSNCNSRSRPPQDSRTNVRYENEKQFYLISNFDKVMDICQVNLQFQ